MAVLMAPKWVVWWGGQWDGMTTDKWKDGWAATSAATWAEMTVGALVSLLDKDSAGRWGAKTVACLVG